MVVSKMSIAKAPIKYALTDEQINIIKKLITANETVLQGLEYEKQFSLDFNCVENKHVKNQFWQIALNKLKTEIVWLYRYNVIHNSQSEFSYDWRYEVHKLVMEYIFANYNDVWTFIINKQPELYQRFNEFNNYVKNIVNVDYCNIFDYSKLINLSIDEQNEFFNSIKYTKNNDVERFLSMLNEIDYFYKNYNLIHYNLPFVINYNTNELANNYLLNLNKEKK